MGSFNSKNVAPVLQRKEKLEANQCLNWTSNGSAVRGKNAMNNSITYVDSKPHASLKKIIHDEKVTDLREHVNISSDIKRLELEAESNIPIQQTCPIEGSSFLYKYLEDNDKQSGIDFQTTNKQTGPSNIKAEPLHRVYTECNTPKSVSSSLQTKLESPDNSKDISFIEQKFNVEDLKNKKIKQELIDENTTIFENNVIYEVPNNGDIPLFKFSCGAKLDKNSIDGNKLQHYNVKHNIIKKEPSDEEIEKSPKPKKWVANPFSIASVAGEYAFLGSAPKTCDEFKIENIHKEMQLSRSKSQKVSQNENVSAGDSEDIKAEEYNDSLLDRKSDGNSGFHSLSNTSFDSLPEISNKDVSSHSACTEKSKWMVKLPKHNYEPGKIMQCNAKQKEYEAGIKQGGKKIKRIMNLKSVQSNLKKPKINRKNEPKTRSRHKLDQKNKGSRVITRKKLKNKSNRRVKETDKTYSCSISNNILEEIKSRPITKRARACKLQYLNPKEIALFPKPLLDRKPQIATPPAPMKTSCFEPKYLDIKKEGAQCSFETRFKSDNYEMDDFKIDNYNLQTHHLLHRKEIYEQKKTIKKEIPLAALSENELNLENVTSGEIIDCKMKENLRICERAVESNTIELSRAHVPKLNLEPNNILLRTMQPNVLLKRLVMPKHVESIQSEQACRNSIKNERMLNEEIFKNVESKNIKKEYMSHISDISVKQELISTKVECDLLITSLNYDNQLNLKPKVCTKWCNESSQILSTPQTNIEHDCSVNVKWQMNFNDNVIDIKKELTQVGAVGYQYPLSAIATVQDSTKTIISTEKPKVLEPEGIVEEQHNDKLFQPKVRIKRLPFSKTNANSLKLRCKRLKVLVKRLKYHDYISSSTKHKFSINLQPVVRVKRLKVFNIKSDSSTSIQNVDNHTKQLTVDLEIKHEREFFTEKSTYMLRKKNKFDIHIKEEKVSTKRSADADILTSTPTLCISHAYSLYPLVRLKRLKYKSSSNIQLDTILQENMHVTELETQIKIESIEVEEGIITPATYVKQYEEEDSGISLDSTCNSSTSLNICPTDNLAGILFEIAMQRASINHMLLQHGYSPIHFRLYNDINDLKTFLNYLLDE